MIRTNARNRTMDEFTTSLASSFHDDSLPPGEITIESNEIFDETLPKNYGSLDGSFHPDSLPPGERTILDASFMNIDSEKEVNLTFK